MILDEKHRWNTMKQRMMEQEEERKHLHNTVMELKGNIRVFCRIRSSKKQSIVTIVEAKGTVKLATTTTATVQKKSTTSNGKKKDQNSIYTFNQVFPSNRSQLEVFKQVTQFVTSGLDGYNVSIITCGTSGSGKTYTMIGSGDQDVGILPRSIQMIFETIDIRSQQLDYSDWKYTVTVSYIEIDQNNIRDLLSDMNRIFKMDDIKNQ
jgi:kinesin family protein C1